MKRSTLAALFVLTSGIAFGNVFEDKAKEFCDKGEAEVCTDLGNYYREGNSKYQIEKDATKAVEMLTKGCDLSSSAGCNVLGYMHGNGLGVKKDLAKAAELYQKACDGSEATGCFNLGVMYDNGQGVKKNVIKAVELYQKACTGGDDTGCFNLGMKYYKGDGVRKNNAEALKSFNKACSMKVQDACDAYANLKSGKLK